MRALQGLVQVELRAAHHHLVAEVDEGLEHVLEGERPGTAAHEGNVVDGEAALQRGILEERVEHHVGVGVFLDDELDADALTVGELADVGDALDLLLVHHLADAGEHVGLVDHIRDLGDDDRLAAVVALLDLGLGADHHAAAAGAVGVHDALAAHDDAAGREVRALDVFHQLLGRDVGVVDIGADGVADLAQVVRGHVRGHTDGDARGAVEQQQRELGRQHRRLLEGVVEVERHVDGILVDVGEDILGHLLELGLGVSHGGHGVAVHRAEVALAVDQRIALVPGLRQAGHGVVDAGVAVRVELTEYFTDDTGRFLGLSAVVQAQAVHTEKYAALYGFEAVPGVREGAGHDHGHRVIDVGRAHLMVDLDRFYDSCHFFLDFFRILNLTVHKNTIVRNTQI